MNKLLANGDEGGAVKEASSLRGESIGTRGLIRLSISSIGDGEITRDLVGFGGGSIISDMMGSLRNLKLRNPSSTVGRLGLSLKYFSHSMGSVMVIPTAAASVHEIHMLPDVVNSVLSPINEQYSKGSSSRYSVGIKCNSSANSDCRSSRAIEALELTITQKGIDAVMGKEENKLADNSFNKKTKLMKEDNDADVDNDILMPTGEREDDVPPSLTRQVSLYSFCQ